jgi:uncharacterized protein (DUF1697 family)
MRQIALLRGVNLGPRNRIAMPALRELLNSAGFEDVRTHLRSGNVVLSSGSPPEQVAVECERLIGERFDLDIDVVARTRDELAQVVRRNPLGEVADDPKRYQVSFLETELAPQEIRRLATLAVGDERLAAIGRELYAWHPDGVARSRLWAGLADRALGVKATARNWTTTTTLLRIADE